MKRFITLLLVIVFVISMLFISVGCKKAVTTETTAAATTAAQETTGAAETTATATTAAETTANKGEIVVAAIDSRIITLEPFAKEFTEKTGIKVTFQSIPSGEPLPMYATYWINGVSPYDVCEVDDGTVIGVGTPGWLLPLNDIIPAETWDDFTPSIMERMNIWDKYQGNFIRIPHSAELQYVYVRKDLLDAKGLAVPTTWDEMVNVGKEFAKENIWGTVDALGKGGMCFVYISYLVGQAGGDVFAFDEGTAEAFKFVYDMINTYKIFPKDAISYTYDELNLAYTKDRVIMIRQWPYARDVFMGDKAWYSPDKVTIVLPPKGPANNKSWMTSWGWSIPKYAKNIEGAKEFIKFITSNDVQSRLALVASDFVVTRKSVFAAMGDKGITPYLKMYDEAGAIGNRPYHLKVNEAQEIVENMLHSYLLGEITLDEAMKQGKSLIEALGPRE